MTTAALLKRYFWLLRCFQSGPISKAEIDSRWSRSALNTDNESAIPRSTFFVHRKEIEELFGVKVACNAKGEYYIAESERDFELHQQWILSSLAIGLTLQECESLRSSILLESFPNGTQNLSTIVDALKNHLRIDMVYGSFKHAEQEFSFSPFALRVFRQRWYVVGESSQHPNEVRVYALDRIKQLHITCVHFQVPRDFDPEEFFAHRYGVTVGDGVTPVTIQIKVASGGVPYLRSLPLHTSQEEIVTETEYSVFEYFLAPNTEFIQELLSRSDEIEVLQPETLRARFREVTQKLCSRYLAAK